MDKVVARDHGQDENFISIHLIGFPQNTSSRSGTIAWKSALGLLLVFTATTLGGCVPPALISASALLFSLPAVLVVTVLLVACSINGGHYTIRTESIYLLTLYVLCVIPFLRSIVARIARAPRLLMSSYGMSLFDAGLSALTIAGAVALVSRFHPGLPAARYWALATFLGFFVLNSGYYFSQEELASLVRDLGEDEPDNHPSSIAESKFLALASLGTNLGNRPITGVAITGFLLSRFHYAFFLIAPIFALIVWLASGSPAANLMVLNLRVLLGFLIVSISLGAMLKASALASGEIPDDAVSDEGRVRRYLASGRARQVLMTDNCHDAIIVGLLVFGWLQLREPGQVLEQAQWLALGIVAGFAMFGFLPFYFGQRAAVEKVVERAKTDYESKVALRKRLLLEGPLVPKASSLTSLVSAVTAGGLLTAVVDKLLVK